MHINVSASVIVNRSPSQVFALLIDLSKWPQWGGGNLVSMEQVSPGPLQVGSRIRQINRTGRNVTETPVQVTDLVPGQSFGIERPNLQGVFTLEPTATGARLNARFGVEAAGIPALLYRLLLAHFVKMDLSRFKAMVEAS